MSSIIAKAQASKTRTHVVNIKSYGAKIDGVTNDLPAIQAAINSITTGAVVLPAGNIRIDGTIVLKDGITLEGQGSDVTTLILGAPFFSATAKAWTSYTTVGDVLYENVTNKKVIICLSGGSSTNPTGSQVYIKNVTLKPVTSPSSIYDIVGIYGVFTKGAMENASTSYCGTGLLVGLFNSEVKGSGSLANGNIGIRLLESKDALIQKVGTESNVVGIDILSNTYSVALQSVDFSSSLVAIRVAKNCGNISVSTPCIDNITGNPYIIHPSSEVIFVEQKLTSNFLQVNTVSDGYLAEPNTSFWTIDQTSLGGSAEVPSIKKAFTSSDTYLAKAKGTGNRRLYVDPKDANGVYVSTTSQRLGLLDFRFHARSTTQLRMHIENADSTIVYDSGWLSGLLVSGENSNILPRCVYGTTLDDDDSAGTSTPYTIKVYSSGIHPFYIDKVAMFEVKSGYLAEEAVINYTIETEDGFHVYNWDSGSDSLTIPLGYDADYKTKLDLLARVKSGNGETLVLGAGPNKEDILSYATLYDNGSYQYFSFEFNSSGTACLTRSNDTILDIIGLGVQRLYDTVDNTLVLSGAPSVGWYPIGTKIAYSLASGITGWTCINNASFPNGFSSTVSEGLNYTWSGTYLGIRRDSELGYTYTDLSGPALEYSWSGTSLGVRIEGTGTPYTYQNLGGISGLQGPTGATGSQGVKGDTGTSFQYAWSGLYLGIKISGTENYDYTNLQGATGSTGPIGPSGLTGSGLLYLWSGASLGVRAIDEPSYTYTDLRGPGLEFAWSGMSLGVRVSGIGDYSYTNVAGISGLQGPTGATGSTGPTGASGVAAVYGKLTSNNGYVFSRAGDGSYNISTTTLTANFYRGNSSSIASRTVEIRQINDQVYEYATIAGAGETTTYTAVRDTPKQNITVTVTHPASATSISQNVSLVKDGTSLEYNWSGTSLGIRVSGVGSYSYVNLSGQVGATGSTGAAGARGYMGSGLLYDVAGTRIGVKTFDELVYTYTDDLRPSGVNNMEVSGTLYASYPSGIRMRSTDDLKDFWLYISNSGGAGYQLYIREI